MSYFKKMVMISLEEYNKYRNQMFALQTTPNVNPMQKELQELKEQYGDSLLPDQKAKLEGEIISKYTSKPIEIKEDNEIAKEEEVENIEWVKSAINEFSKTNKNKATQMYSILLNKLGARWNSKGELKLSDGSKIDGSNILDLINFVTSSSIRSTQKPPIGFNYFIDIIKEANLPTFLFSKKGQNAIDSYVGHDHTDNDDDEFNKQSSKRPKGKPTVSKHGTWVQ